MRRLFSFFLLVTLPFSVGCTDDATCEAFVDNAIRLTVAKTRELGLPEEQAREIAEKRKAERDEAVKKCKEANPTKEALACAARAKTLEDMQACEVDLED